jgi:hypothetical protein
MQINPAPVISLLDRITHIESLAVLTAMITPALLISASGTFILSTSNRLGRVVDRIRGLSDKMEELLDLQDTKPELFDKRRILIFNQMGQLSRRVSLLQRGLTFFYLAAALFIAASIAIGLAAIASKAGQYEWIPGILGLSGAFCLFIGAISLLNEVRIAVTAAQQEMAFFDELTAHHRRLVE